MKQKFSLTKFFTITGACLFALALGACMAGPCIAAMEVQRAAVHDFDRH